MRRKTTMGWLQHDITNRGVTAWLLSAAILTFYVVLYFGHRLTTGSWNTAENWVFVILFAGILAVGGVMLWSDAQEPDSLRPQQMRATAIGLVATLLLACFVYVTPMLLKWLGQTGFAASVAKLEWGNAEHAVFQVLYGALGGAGVVAIFTHNKDTRQPYKILGLLAILLAATALVLVVSSYLIAHAFPPDKKAPSFSIGYGVLHGLSLLKWVFAGFGATLAGGVGLVMSLPQTRKLHGGKYIPESQHSFVGIIMTLGFLFALLALVHIAPTVLGALHAKSDPFDAVAKSMGLGSKWMFYGLLYTVCITAGGSYMIWKYWHNKYQIVRTTVVMLVQITLAFSIPWILKLFQRPDYYFSYIWPLKIDYFYPSTIAYQINNGLPVAFIVYSFVAALFLAPVLGLVFGKRWYCSWVCGCGGLANTFGEPWRHLSNKSSKAWLFEKFSIHGVMVVTFAVTALSLLTYWYPGLNNTAKEFRVVYGLAVTAVLSGVVGVGLYPLGGTRVWCRFACPMAAVLGLLQKLGRFRIRVKRDMCISCGLCSKYCEMGIDVRAYAQRNENFTRASCVGCGLCSEVCPRGVLRLENVPRKDR